MADNIPYEIVEARYIEIKNDACKPAQDIELYDFGKNKNKNADSTSSGSKKATIKPKRTSYQYQFQKARTDKRVSLNVAPLQFDKSGNFNPSKEPFAKRIEYVLGSKIKTLPKGQTIYGFLNSCLSNSCGLIFPYTPTISISHQVNYERSDITHSNVAISHYKNTPPPSYSLDAVFTADTRENALHMLSAIWFLRAVTKCDFGEQANNGGEAGMPPPVLYLNGYNQIMDNIPVVVKSFSYSLPNDKDYVALGVNLDSSNMVFNNRKQYSDTNGDFYDNYDGNGSSNVNGLTYLNGIINAVKNLQSDVTNISANRYNSWYFNNWLPTEMSFKIDLEVQPNLLKYKKQFNLDDYKMGAYNLDNYKGDTSIQIPTDNGLQDCTNQSIERALEIKIKNKTNAVSNKVKGIIDNVTNSFSNVLGTSTINDKIISTPINNDLTSAVLKSTDLEKLESGMGLSMGSNNSYKFDRSGFTW